MSKIRKLKPAIRNFKRLYKILSEQQLNEKEEKFISTVLFIRTWHLHSVLGSKFMVKLFKEVGDFENARRYE